LIGVHVKTVGLNQRGRPGKTPSGKAGISKPTLQEAGIDYKLESQAQRLAAVPQPKFESLRPPIERLFAGPLNGEKKLVLPLAVIQL
jgi:hypothetical protein